MGINFSRLLTLKYGNSISNYLHTKYSVISVGRVMTCVLGMVVRREREIRDFVKTPFYRVVSTIDAQGISLRENGKQSKAHDTLSHMISIRKMDLRKEKKQKN